MTKKELIEKYKTGKLPVIASTSITHNFGIAICEIQYDIDDKVFGFIDGGETKEFFLVKLKYLKEKIVFNVGKMRFDIDDFVRI